MLPRKTEDAPANEQTELCEACGKHPSGCAAWGHRLCYGDSTGRIGCATKLAADMPFENEEQFTHAWVAEHRANERAA